MNPQGAQIDIPLFGNAAQMTPVTAAAFVRGDPQPAGELPTGFELFRFANRRHQCGAGDQANTGDSLQAGNRFVMPGCLDDLLFQAVHGFLQPLQFVQQRLEQVQGQR